MKAKVEVKYSSMFSHSFRKNLTVMLVIEENSKKYDVEGYCPSFQLSQYKAEKVMNQTCNLINEGIQAGVKVLPILMLNESFNPPYQDIEGLFSFMDEHHMTFSPSLTKIKKFTDNLYKVEGRLRGQYHEGVNFNFVVLSDELMEKFESEYNQRMESASQIVIA